MAFPPKSENSDGKPPHSALPSKCGNRPAPQRRTVKNKAVLSQRVSALRMGQAVS